MKALLMDISVPTLWGVLLGLLTVLAFVLRCYYCLTHTCFFPCFLG